MSTNKTQPTKIDPVDYIKTIEPQRRQEEGLQLLELFKKASGFEPVMWGESIIGFGRYHYQYKSGREGDFPATGFSPRKAAHSIYIMPGYQDYSAMLERLGKVRTGKSCLYISNLAKIDLGVLEELIITGLRDLDRIWKVLPC